jgi:glutamate formiminotransferase / formiminotetrahydrofolate cyclodeaminase
MHQVIVCEVTFSEGERREVLDALAGAVVRSGARLVEVRPDPHRGRAEMTWLGEPASIERAILAAAAVAAPAIDMTDHRDRDALLGAIDTITLSSVADTLPEVSVDLARRVARQAATELGVPVYLFGAAATRRERVRLDEVRAGGCARLATVIDTEPGLAPDFGPRQVGPAGALAIGVLPLRTRIAIALDGADMALARDVAGALDGRSGGLAGVEAAAVPTGTDGVGVVVTVTDVDQTPLSRVTELAGLEAERCGARLARTEVRGLVPEAALRAAAAWYLRLGGVRDEQVLEHAVGALRTPEVADDLVPRHFIDAVASDEPTPGGGTVAALAGALGAALTSMVAGLTVGRPKYVHVEDEMQRLRHRAAEVQEALVDLMTADSQAFEAVMAAYRLPRDTADDADRRRDAIQAALRHATEVPLTTMRHAVDVMRIARQAAAGGNVNAVSDAGVGAYLAHAAAQSASLNVAINIMGLRDLDEGDRYRRASNELLVEARSLNDEVDRLVRERIKG